MKKQPTEILKTCSACKESKPLDAFARYSKGKYGKHNKCKACVNLNGIIRKRKPELLEIQGFRCGDNSKDWMRKGCGQSLVEIPLRYIEVDHVLSRDPNVVKRFINHLADAHDALWHNRIENMQDWLHDDDNLQVLHQRCNRMWNNKVTCKICGKLV